MCPCQCIVKRAAFDAKGAAYGGFAGPVLDSFPYGLQGFLADGMRPSASLAAFLCRFQTGQDAFPGQSPFVLGQRPECIEQKLPVRGCGVHLFGEGAEGHVACLKIGDDVQQVRKGPPQSVKFPYHQAVTGTDIVQFTSKAGPVVPRPAGFIFEQVPFIHTRRDQCIALQAGCLAVGVARHPHVADHHIRKTPSIPFLYSRNIRQCFPYR